MVIKSKKTVKKGKPRVSIMEEADNVHLLVDFTATQLKICYDKLTLYPAVQEDIAKLIIKLANIL